MMSLAELAFAHRDLVAEVNAHNCAVIIRRRQGCDWAAPENQYRNALAEVAMLEAQKVAA